MKEAKEQFLERYALWGFPQSDVTLPTVIRFNTLQAPVDVVKNSFEKGIKLSPISYLPFGFVIDAPYSLASSLPYLQGYFYIQESASQLPVLVLDPQKNDVVLDMCAAPGSKTTQLAQVMENTGEIVAMDSHKLRLQKLQYNLERCGVTNCSVVHENGLYVADLGVKFDRILLDAPCSGNFAIDEKWFDKRTLTDFSRSAELQKELLAAAVSVLKPGGVLVYSTCSLEKEEDEDVVEWALEEFSSLSLVPTGLTCGSTGLTSSTKNCTRMWPTQHGTQGFFVAKFVKASNN